MKEILQDLHALKMELAGIKTQETVETIIATCVPAIVVDLETSTIVYSTPLADDIFGYIRGELQGKTLNDLMPERFHQQHKQHVENYSHNPMPRMMGERGMSLIGKKRDGSEITVEISLHPRAIGGKRFVVATVFSRKV